MLLNAYLRDCLEEWCTSGSQLSARFIMLLDNCARSITRRFRLLDGEGQCYFGQFKRLAWRILRAINVEEAHWQAKQEMASELDREHIFDLCVSQKSEGQKLLNIPNKLNWRAS